MHAETYATLDPETRIFLLGTWIDTLLQHSRTAEAHRVLERFIADRPAALPNYPGPYLRDHGIQLDRLLARVEIQEGRPDLAIPIAQRALEAARETGEGDLIDSTAATLADGYLSSGQHERVIALLTPLVEGGEHDRLLIHLALAHYELGLRGGEHRHRAEELLTRVAGEESLPAQARIVARGRLALLDLEAQAFESALEEVAAARRLSSLGAADGAFLTALEHEAELGAGRSAEASAERLIAEVDALIQSWQGLGSPPGGVGFLRDMRERLYLGEYLELIAKRRGARAAFDRLNEIQALASLSRILGGDAGSVEEIEERLIPPGGVLLSLMYGRKRLLVFELEGSGEVELHLLSPGPNLIQDARDYQHRISLPPDGRRPAGEARELASRFFDRALRERIEKASSVVLVGGEMFAGLSFESLPLLSQRPLGVDRALWRLPSVPCGLALARRPHREPGFLDLLLVSDPSVGIERPGLSSLVEPVAAERTSVLESASLPRLAQELEAHPAAVHLFTHGLLLADSVIPAGLRLARGQGDDGEVSAEEVLALDWPELVLLSVCGAASGPLRIGDAASADLRGAFLRGGARCVVGSSADLNREATRRLMVHVTAALAAGADVAEALRRGRAALWNDPATRDPYYTCLVQAFGVPPRVRFHPREPKRSGRLLFTLLVAAALGVTWFVLRSGKRRRA